MFTMRFCELALSRPCPSTAVVGSAVSVCLDCVFRICINWNLVYSENMYVYVHTKYFKNIHTCTYVSYMLFAWQTVPRSLRSVFSRFAYNVAARQHNMYNTYVCTLFFMRVPYSEHLRAWLAYLIWQITRAAHVLCAQEVLRLRQFMARCRRRRRRQQPQPQLGSA